MDVLEQALEVMARAERAKRSEEQLENADRLREIARAMEMAAHNSVDYDLIGDPRKSYITGKWF